MTANFILSTLLMAVTAAPSGEIPARPADAHDFSRYQIILNRSPFSPPAGSVAEVQPNFAARYSFIGTVQLDETKPLMAVIQDKEAGNRIYFKEEGETITIGGATVVRIGPSPGAKLLLKQGLETATLTLETKAGVGAAPPAPIPGAGSQPPVPVVQPGGVRRIPFRRGD